MVSAGYPYNLTSPIYFLILAWRPDHQSHRMSSHNKIGVVFHIIINFLRSEQNYQCSRVLFTFSIPIEKRLVSVVWTGSTCQMKHIKYTVKNYF